MPDLSRYREAREQDMRAVQRNRRDMGARRMKHYIDILWHRLLGYEWIPTDLANAETGTCDFYCRCWLCKQFGRVIGNG